MPSAEAHHPGMASNPEDPPAAEDPRLQLGPTIRRRRQAAGLSLRELGARSGLAASTLSKIENSQISPTYDSLLRLVDGLGLDLAQLFDPTSVDPAHGRRVVTRRGGGVHYRTPHYDFEVLCAEVLGKRFVPFLATLTARSVTDFGQLPRHEGEEFVFVLEGRVEVHTDQHEPVLLQAGDSCYLDSTMGHGCLAVGEEPARILWVTSQAGFDPRAVRLIPQND